MRLSGHGAAPTEDETNRFMRAVTEFFNVRHFTSLLKSGYFVSFLVFFKFIFLLPSEQSRQGVRDSLHARLQSNRISHRRVFCGANGQFSRNTK